MTQKMVGLLFSEIDGKKIGFKLDLKMSRVFSCLMSEGRELHEFRAVAISSAVEKSNN